MMVEYDHGRPYWGLEAMETFTAIQGHIAFRYGKTVKAMPLANREYQRRFDKFGAKNNMMPPPDNGRIFSGFLVVRNLGTSRQYETWMSDQVFEELYRKQS